MTKGGARSRSGPPPDPLALRRDRPGGADGWETLPSAGRDGEPPAWPLSDGTDRELSLWASEWRRPQAIKWEQNGQALGVALYVRTLVAAESPLATAAMRVLVLRQQDELGISFPGMSRNKWRIGTPITAVTDPPAPAARKAPAKKGSTAATVRSRMQVLNGGA